jgi:molybdopterin/thiamine biosynthesis adenylyltransferase
LAADLQAKKALRESIKILVIGAGGLGCEILQNLALSQHFASRSPSQS